MRAFGLLSASVLLIALAISFDFGLVSAIIAAAVGLAIHTFRLGDRRYPRALLVLFAGAWLILAVNVTYRYDWVLENIITAFFVPLIVVIHRKARLSNSSYTLIFLFMFLHTLGSHYTYAETPLGYWLQDILGLARNHYDRIVHFAFGLLFAYPIRELALRAGKLRGFWAYYIPVELTLAISALYEIIEWVTALVFGGDLGVAFLGTQGDVWDAQKDMGLAFLGALIAMVWIGVARLMKKYQS